MSKKIVCIPVLNWVAAAAAAIFLSRPAPAEVATPATVTIQADAPGTKISPDLFGIFFEDINYAADGGLYAELIQNRSFEYSATEQPSWNLLTSWELTTRGGGRGSLAAEAADPLDPNNPHYAVLEVANPGAGVGLVNPGFDGIPVKAGENYDVSLFAKQLFVGNRWGGSPKAGNPPPLIARLESKGGQNLGEVSLSAPGWEWSRLTGTIQATATDPAARFVLLATGRGGVALDVISLFPQKTFHNRPNGLRADLAQAIADLHPKFIRFPGGCLTHGNGLGNIYRWKDTIGPVEQRKEQANLWGYHQTVGLGYFEYFQFCEDIGAKPLPVIAAAVCCQNSGHTGGTGQQGLALELMPAYIQDILNLIEWANGPTNSMWGAKRAAAGHPAPFNLQYLGVGNEDAQTDVFRERFKLIYDAIKAKHPEITVVGTVGPSPSGLDYDAGWKFADALGVDIVDEHYYEKPEWFLANLNRYDSYNRAATKVYVGEYASWGNTLFNALAEAAYMTSLERNGDVVRMASYAPLLGKEQHLQWRTDLIYFDTTTVSPSVNYYVQQLFSQNQGDVYLPTTVSSASPENRTRSFLLGTWDTQAQFAAVKVVGGAQTLLDEPFAGGATNWTAESGQWSATNGVYSQSADGQPAISRLTTTIDQPDYTLTLKARKTGGSEGFLIGFGATDAGSYYWWNLGGWGNTQHGVEKTSNGTKSLIGAQVAGTLEPGRWYDIKIEVAGARIKCYLDGVLIHDLNDAGNAGASSLAASCVKDTNTGDVIVKLVNVTAVGVPVQVNLPGLGQVNPAATKTVLTGKPAAEDSFASPGNIIPATTDFTVGNSFGCDAPPYSLTVIRMKTH